MLLVPRYGVIMHSCRYVKVRLTLILFFRPVKNCPGFEVRTKRVKSMFSECRHNEDIPGSKVQCFFAVEESPVPRNNNVKFVPRMGLLIVPGLRDIQISRYFFSIKFLREAFIGRPGNPG